MRKTPLPHSDRTTILRDLTSISGAVSPWRLRTLHYVGALSLIALIFLNLAWEAWLAPTARVVLIIKTLPLLLPLFGVLHAKRYTFQWSSMLILFYFTEGIVRAFSDAGISAQLALAEIILSLVYFLAAIFYARLSRGVALRAPSA